MVSKSFFKKIVGECEEEAGKERSEELRSDLNYSIMQECIEVEKFEEYKDYKRRSLELMDNEKNGLISNGNRPPKRDRISLNNGQFCSNCNKKGHSTYNCTNRRYFS